MKTDGLFQTLTKTLYVREGEPIYLLPFGDVHRDAELHADGEWQEWLAYVKQQRSHAYLLGIGDYLDFARAHTRAMVEADGAAGSKEIQDCLQRGGKYWAGIMAAELKPFKSRIIGLLSGNHYMEFIEKHRGEETKTHSDAWLARKLGTEYLGVMAAITLTLLDSRKRMGADVRIVAHHGTGGATTVGGSLNRVQRFLSGWHADVALMGDDHKRGCVPTQDRLGVMRVGGRDIITASTQFVARTGSFLRGFSPGKSSYVTDQCYTPTSIGTIELEFTLKRDTSTGKPAVKIRSIQ